MHAEVVGVHGREYVPPEESVHQAIAREIEVIRESMREDRQALEVLRDARDRPRVGTNPEDPKLLLGIEILERYLHFQEIAMGALKTKNWNTYW